MALLLVAVGCGDDDAPAATGGFEGSSSDDEDASSGVTSGAGGDPGLGPTSTSGAGQTGVGGGGGSGAVTGGAGGASGGGGADGKPFAAKCAADSECASATCHKFGKKGKRCTRRASPSRCRTSRRAAASFGLQAARGRWQVKRQRLVPVLAVLAACTARPDDDALGDGTPVAVSYGVQAQGTVFGTGGDGLNVRAEPSLQSEIVGHLADGAKVAIGCQQAGDPVNGNPVWDFVVGKGGFIADRYVWTGHAS